MDIVIEFQGRKSPGVECNRVQVTIRSRNGKDSGECIVRGVSLNCNLSVWDPMGKDQSCGESLFKCFKGRMALIGEMPGGTLVGKMHKQNCDFRISVNETMVEIGKAEEGLNILDFSWNWPILDDLNLVWAMVRPSGDSIYLRYLQEVTWNLHLSAWAKSLLAWSLWHTSQTWALCLEMLLK